MKPDKSNFYLYNKDLRPFANNLRKQMTKAEACLWKYALRARMRRGYQFRRQRPVSNYIADFMCMELKLIIEVDGFTHQHDEVIAKDEIRQRNLEDAGFIIIRFEDDIVLNHINTVIQEIDDKIEEIEKTTP